MAMGLLVAAVAWSADAVIKPQVKDFDMSDYKLAWSDEFDGAKLDLDKWDYRTDSKMHSAQKPENVSVADGKLILHLKKEEAGKMHYTGAGVISKRTFKYGYYEARLKTPPGSGWHTSFWLQKHDGSGTTAIKQAFQELDVIENDSTGPDSYDVAVHRWKTPYKSFAGKKVWTPNHEKLSDDFHTFGCEFTPLTIKYFFDGNLVQTVNVSVIEHNDQNIWLTSIAMRTGGNKGVDDSRLPATAEFEYVRFFEPTGN